MEKSHCGGGVCEGGFGGHGGCCGESMHGCHGGNHYLVKIILKFIVIALIFMFGFNLGQMTGFIRAEYGGYGRSGMMKGINSYYGGGMMRGYTLQGTVQTPLAPK